MENSHPMESPLVSILCMTYNHEDNVAKTLDGFLMQETDFPFAIWIHDDASTDDTQAILLEYQSRHPDQIRLTLQSENQFALGVKPLLKYVLPHVHSKYISFCEGDDFWTDKSKLQRQVDVLERRPNLSLCAHDVDLTFEHGVRPQSNFYTKPKEGNFEFSFLEELTSPFFSSASILIKTADFKRLPPAKGRASVVSGDLRLFLFLLSLGNGYYIDRPMARKRKNPGGITQSDKYRNLLLEGTYEMLLYVKPFAPRNARAHIRKSLAEFERHFVLTKKSLENHTRLQLTWRALRHDPLWLRRRPPFRFWAGFVPENSFTMLSLRSLILGLFNVRSNFDSKD